MTAEHNHPPRCCCDIPPGDMDPADADPTYLCPACPDHGQLAQGVECPQCHQTAGRPHTDYCTLAPERVWAVTVLVSTELLTQMEDWSPPVQIQVRRTPGIGSGYEMIARTINVEQIAERARTEAHAGAPASMVARYVTIEVRHLLAGHEGHGVNCTHCATQPDATP